MPEVVDCAGSHFGTTDFDIFGAQIPIAACMADQVQQPSLYNTVVPTLAHRPCIGLDLLIQVGGASEGQPLCLKI